MALHKKSLSGQLTFSSYMLMVLLTIPVVISLSVMVFYAVRYHTSLARIETIAALEPMISDEISGELWSAISGMKSFEDCGVYDTIREVNDTLQAQTADADQTGQLQLTVALRTMETLSGYVSQIEANMTTGVPVAESEALLEEVRNVAVLASSMLDEFTAQVISDTTETTSRLRRIVTVTALIELLLVIIAFILAQYMLHRTQRLISKPIEEMEHFAGLVASGNLQARIPPTDVQELETLTDSYNTMANRLEVLIEQNRQKQENLTKSELRLLQEQINPHFLYNTLDAIVWQAESGQSDEVVKLTSALSDFFRISLSSGAEWIPVSQEIKHVTGYLSIQKTRYRDILRTELDMDPAMDSYYMLKLLLQPLVENALYHGIKNRRGGGVIRVSGRLEGDWLCFTVSDTGVGMTSEKLAAVRAMLRQEQQRVFAPQDRRSGFGLLNVDQRIRLYYKQEEGLRIDSDANGTTVTFRVPCRRREEFEHDESLPG